MFFMLHLPFHQNPLLFFCGCSGFFYLWGILARTCVFFFFFFFGGGGGGGGAVMHWNACLNLVQGLPCLCARLERGPSRPQLSLSVKALPGYSR